MHFYKYWITKVFINLSFHCSCLETDHSLLVMILTVPTKYLTRDNLKEKGLISAHSSRGSNLSWWQEHKAAGHSASAVRKERER